jgi:2-oxoglutarate ferredoxin oxidoreductase subunit delta
MKQTPRRKERKKTSSADKGRERPSEAQPDAQVTLYPAWCKRCGNCAAFCPRQVLEMDEWGYPFVAHPEKCVTCHLCEMLCPDFAISVEEYSPSESSGRPKRGTHRIDADAPENLKQSPERVAPEPSDEENDRG